MKMKYCPNCGSISEQSFSPTIKCTLCRYIGKPYEGSIDEINAFRKRVKNNKTAPARIPDVEDTNTHNPAKEMSIGDLSSKLQGMKGKKTGDFEFL